MGHQKPQPTSGETLVDAFTRRRGQLRSIAAKAGVEEAPDVVQDTLLKAVEAGRKGEIANPIHLLARIARNTVIDRLRARARHTLIFERGDPGDVGDGAPSPERALIASERLSRAMQAIDNMPVKRRQVFLLHRIDELRYAEIARRLGISIKTVEKHMALAMEQLAREVDGDA